MSVIRVSKKFNNILSGSQKIRIIELAFLMIVGGFLEMFSVSLVLPFMNAVMNPTETMGKWYAKLACNMLNIKSPRQFLVLVAIILALVYILKNIYLLFEFNMQYRFVYGNMFEMQRRLLSNLLSRPYEFYLKVNSGEIIRVVNSDTSSSFILLSTLLSLFTELIVSSMLIITIFVITPLTTLCMAVVLLVLLMVISKILKPILRRAGLSNQESYAGMNKWLLQAIQGIKEIKVMGKEKYFQSNFDFYGKEYVNSYRRYQILNITPRFFIEAISMGTMFIIVAVLIYNGSELESIIPMLTAVAMAAMRLLPSVNRISSAIANVAFNEPMLDKLIENLNSFSSDDNISLDGKFLLDVKIDKSTNQIRGVERNIELKNISFHYPDSTDNIFSNASLMVKKGESIGIVGSSGAGKTTVIDIILGLLNPQLGSVLVDGINISNDIEGWHKQIGYIPQMIFMLDDSIKNNVCFGVQNDDISVDNLWNALKDASLDEFVKSLPNGLDTEIGERGVRLSGGQRQRIGIARALYFNPEILVFDEATSALDTETESAIMESIHALHGQKTMIIIAHRLTTIESCDHIYRVENNKIYKER